jgi:branched-chain amino acid transport system substrate-binding protein
MKKTRFGIPFPWPLGLALALLALSLVGNPLSGQELNGGESPERVFQEAAKNYREADYYRALIGFRKLLRDFPEHQRITAALLMQAKCYYWLQNYNEAIQSLKILLENFEHSTYLDNAQYLLGNCYYRQGQFWPAADEFRQVVQTTDVPALADLARDCLRVLIAAELSHTQLVKLYQSLPDDPLSPWILLETARRDLAAGRREEAATAAEQILSLFPDSEAVVEAEEIRKIVLEQPPQEMIIGVVCPLSGQYAQYGDELRNGVMLAIEDHNTRSATEVRLEVRDTRDDAVTALQVTKSLIDELGALAIVGPLLNATAIGAGAISDCRGVPLIIPTASEGGIAAIGQYVFQRGVAARVLAQKMAAYAVDELGLRQFALLAPSDDYGSAAADGFSKEVKERGAEILTTAWYHVGTTDFKEQLLVIRQLKQAYDDSLRSLGLLPVPMHPPEPDTLPPHERRVYIDGIFVPAYPEEAGMIAPQIAYHRLETQILGTSAWGNREAMHIGGRYMDGVVFATDFSEELLSEDYDRFVADYRVRHAKRPGKVAIFGYECARLILQGIEQGAYSRAGLCQFLLATENFPGLSGQISFAGRYGANDEAMILAIQENRVIRLK